MSIVKEQEKRIASLNQELSDTGSVHGSVNGSSHSGDEDKKLNVYYELLKFSCGTCVLSIRSSPELLYSMHAKLVKAEGENEDIRMSFFAVFATYSTTI